jgi:hypothetical protein
LSILNKLMNESSFNEPRSRQTYASNTFSDGRAFYGGNIRLSCNTLPNSNFGQNLLHRGNLYLNSPIKPF